MITPTFAEDGRDKEGHKWVPETHMDYLKELAYFRLTLATAQPDFKDKYPEEWELAQETIEWLLEMLLYRGISREEALVLTTPTK